MTFMFLAIYLDIVPDTGYLMAWMHHLTGSLAWGSFSLMSEIQIKWGWSTAHTYSSFPLLQQPPRLSQGPWPRERGVSLTRKSYILASNCLGLIPP